MRSHVVEPMSWGRLFLAGDAAHIVPPTGAKGLNLAVADVVVLAEALRRWYRGGDPAGLDHYSERCLQRVWRVQEFSTGLTSLLHVDPGQDEFGRQLQRARQAYLVRSPAMRTSLAENYVGLPLDSELERADGEARPPSPVPFTVRVMSGWRSSTAVSHPAVTPTP